MTGIQEDRLKMYLVVLNYVSKLDAGIIGLMPGFSGLVLEFKDLVGALRKIKRKQQLDRKGYRVEKMVLRRSMTNLGMNVAQRIYCYADAIGDFVLETMMTFKQYDVDKYRENDVLACFEGVLKKAEELGLVLNEYGVDSDLITDLRNSIAGFKSSIPKTRSGITERKGCTDALVGMFADGDRLLKRMDGLVRMLRFSNGVFYSGYFLSRKVIYHRSRGIMLRGFIRDTDGVGIEKVAVSIDGTGVKSRKSSKRGYYGFKNLLSGFYTVRFSRTGYVDLVVSLGITSGIRLEHDVVMEKINF